MSSLNKVQIIGRLGEDVKFKTVKDTCVANFSVATAYKSKTQSVTEWHRIQCWGKTAELCSKYTSKGKRIYIEGRLQTDSWEKDGVKRYTTQIVASNVVFLDHTETKPDADKAPDSNEENPF